jgi:hypothetical protein
MPVWRRVIIRRSRPSCVGLDWAADGHWPRPIDRWVVSSTARPASWPRPGGRPRVACPDAVLWNHMSTAASARRSGSPVVSPTGWSTDPRAARPREAAGGRPTRGRRGHAKRRMVDRPAAAPGARWPRETTAGPCARWVGQSVLAGRSWVPTLLRAALGSASMALATSVRERPSADSGRPWRNGSPVLSALMAVR